MPVLNVLLGYLDPGTGAIVLQIVVAAVLATGVFFRRAIFAPFALLRRRGATPSADQAPSETTDAEPRDS
ncbi:MAG: hypothetical protein SFU86_13590 [Pirellulaceae bacterium]|nr:hypothetical protein [Pirellulaceae bacterium]